MSPLASLIRFVFNLLIFGLIAHWILGMFFRESYRPEVMRIRQILNQIYEPMLNKVRGFSGQLRLGEGAGIDFSPAILIVLMLIARFIATMIFS